MLLFMCRDPGDPTSNVVSSLLSVLKIAMLILVTPVALTLKMSVTRK